MSDLRKMARDAGFNTEFDDYVIDHWQRFEKLAELIKDAALSQPEPFNPDWDRVKALEEALREHMAEIQRLKALAQPDESFCDSHCTWLNHHPYCEFREVTDEP